MLTDSRAITDADVAAELAWCERLIALTEAGVPQAQAVAIIEWADTYVRDAFAPLRVAVGMGA